MRITVVTDESKKIVLHVPLWLGLRFALHMTPQNGREEMRALIRGLKAAKKQWGHLKIVEVISSDGDVVEITL